MGNLFKVSLSPHVHGGNSVKKEMYGVILALIPAMLVSFWFFGIGAILVTLTAVASAVLVEAIIQKYLLRGKPTIMDGSAVITGLLLAFNVPSNLPLWIVVIGVIVAIGIGKMTFGGLGQNPFNPALVGRVFLLVSFPAKMTTWPVSGTRFINWLAPVREQNIDGEIVKMIGDNRLDAITGSTPLGVIGENVGTVVEKITAAGDTLRHVVTIPDLMSGKVVIAEQVVKTFDAIPSNLDLLIGQMGGSLGEMSAIAIILGGLFLIVRKIITWHIPVSMLGSMAIFAGLLYFINPDVYVNPIFHILTGGALLGAIFMATDMVTSPMTKLGGIIFGVGIGVLTILIRVFGSYPEGVSFAILIMNAFVPLINTYVKPKRFGEEKKNG
jgi:electron transport complex protein RnfD